MTQVCVICRPNVQELTPCDIIGVTSREFNGGYKKIKGRQEKKRTFPRRVNAKSFDDDIRARRED